MAVNKNTTRTELHFIQPAVDYFRYTDGLEGGDLYRRIADYIWRDEDGDLPDGVLKVCSEARETFSDYESIYFTDVGVELTPNFNPKDYVI